MKRLRAPLLALAALAAAAPAALAAPPGYVRLTSPVFQAPAGIQSHGQVDCPAGTVPWGGGAGFFGGLPDFGMNLNSSGPTASGWRADYNDTSSRAATFGIVAICANAPRRYVQTVATVDNPPATQNSATATCPAHTVLLGGGAFSSSSLPQVVITSAWPSSSTTYTAIEFNGTGSAALLTAFAICGRRPDGY